MGLKIADWAKWQTYRKDRGTPPWIKVHRSLMTNAEWAMLTDSEKGQLVSLWIAAADKEGEIPEEPRILQKVCMLDEQPNINKFIDLGFLTTTCQPDDNQMTTKRQPDDAPETETETETETDKQTPRLPAKAAKRIPLDWQPNKNSTRFVIERGVTLKQAKPVIADFVRYWDECEKKQKNWDLVFQRNPVVKAELAKLKGQNNGTHRPHRKPLTNELSKSEAYLETLKEIASTG